MARRGRTGSPDDLVQAALPTGVSDGRMLAAIAATPRTAFVPAQHVGVADRDRPVPIPHGKVTTQPLLSAMMIAALGLADREQVLEIGTGYRYQAALLARPAAQVASTGIWPGLAAQARRNT